LPTLWQEDPMSENQWEKIDLYFNIAANTAIVIGAIILLTTIYFMVQ
jgi:hypothetical protein